jgi:hypothetical protein
MKKCPKCGYERQPNDVGSEDVCPACGLVFAKWVIKVLGAAAKPALPDQAVTFTEARDNPPQSLRETLLYVEPRTDAMRLYGCVALYIVFVIWGSYFISLDLRSNVIGESFMHRINLVFHEAGHVVFMIFGRFMHVLGGSLGQLLMPVIVMVMLVKRNRDNFGGSIALWWLGQSLKDLAPYINDARDLQLQLLTGYAQDVPETHDWANILNSLHLITHERGIARIDDVCGTLIMLLAMAWGGYILRLQYGNLKSDD